MGSTRHQLGCCQDSNVGYLLEVKITYPQELHDHHTDLPFLAEHRDGELMTTLCDKEKYVLHYRMLKLALEHILKLEKIHRC